MMGTKMIAVMSMDGNILTIYQSPTGCHYLRIPMTKWIKCCETPPPKDRRILVCALIKRYVDRNKYKDFPKLFIVVWGDPDEWMADCGCSGYVFDREKIDPIYWMDLPEPPND